MALRIFWICLLLLSIIVPFASSNYLDIEQEGDKLLINDVSRLNPTSIKEIQTFSLEEAFRDAVLKANQQGYKISISGKRHSQGGHAFYDNATVLYMGEYNNIESLDVKNRKVVVQSGATWEDVQEEINPHNLSIKVMQSSNIFSIGGSLSSNIHGRDPQYGPIIETVNWFRILLPNGTILNVSRQENSELFGLAIGGYGLFGVILDVEFNLAENSILEKNTKIINYTQYNEYFSSNVLNNNKTQLHFGRLSIVPDESFLKEMYVVDYEKTPSKISKIPTLEKEKNIGRDKFLFSLSRKYDWGKRLRWYLQKTWIDNPKKTQTISRNNAMRPSIQFLDYNSKEDTDILQEYFVPRENFALFIDDLRDVLTKNHVNLLSVTVRDVPKSTETFLNYAKEDYYAIVLYINMGLSPEGIAEAEKWTKEIVNLTHQHQGTYYLTYQLFPSKEQLRSVYPEFENFIEKKKKYDPNELLMNQFYERYK